MIKYKLQSLVLLMTKLRLIGEAIFKAWQIIKNNYKALFQNVNQNKRIF
jgi:hypothetical protein